MTTRKKILLISIAVLAVIYAVQLAFSGRSPVKTFRLKEKADTITIISSDQTVKLFLDGGLWYVGDEKAPADDKKIADLVKAVSEIKTLGTVSRFTTETELDRYGFTDTQTITVKAEKAGKELRSILVGKDASSSNTTYIQLDGSSDTLLASGGLRGALTVKAEDLILKIEEPDAPQPHQTQEGTEIQTL